MRSGSDYRITIISGGVGGAKLARGFVQVFPGRINIITNTADDTEFYGLHVSPDLDTMMYTLAGLSAAGKGWGIKDDSFQGLDQLGKYGEATWFELGDRDLATHILRTKMLREGKTLTQVTSYLSRKLGVEANILPMTNEKVETFIKTDCDVLPFQKYFVLSQQKVHIKQVIFKGLRKAGYTAEVSEAINRADLIVFAPSNPVVSILPVLSIPGVRKLVMAASAMKVAVSPFIGKESISGPAKELMEAEGFEGSATGVARFYSKLVDLLFIHYRDRKEKRGIENTGMAVTTTETLMKDTGDSVQLAHQIYESLISRKG